MQPTNPTWNPPADTEGDPESSNLVFPFQPKHADLIDGMSVWRLADDFHTALIGIAVMRSREPLDGSILTATQRLIDRLTVVRDEMLVMRAAEGASFGRLGNDLDRSKSTATDWVNRARKLHGEDRVWVTGRAVDDLPVPPEDVAYVVRGTVELDGIAYTPAQLPADAVIKVGNGNLLLYGKGDVLMVAARGAIALADADTIELRAADGKTARFAVADAERVELDDSGNPTFQAPQAPKEFWDNVTREIAQGDVEATPVTGSMIETEGGAFEVRGDLFTFTRHGRKEFTSNARTIVVNGEERTLAPNMVYTVGGYMVTSYADGIHGYETD